MPAKGTLTFYYPPNFLLLCLPLAWLSYIAALVAFEAVQAALLWPAVANASWGRAGDGCRCSPRPAF